MRIGLDINGGDFAPEAVVLGAALAQKELNSGEQIVLIGDTQKGKAILDEKGIAFDGLEWVEAPDTIGMDEHPARAIGKKPNSSIVVGFNLLKQNQINCFSSCGNTGAMLVGAMYSVRAVSGVIRPCITSALPQENGGIALVLDVGAIADCKPDVLYQFAILGSLYAKFVYNIENPRVGLLNIGEEAEKGNLLTQATYQLMDGSSDFNFTGNIEGRDILSSKADVIVCDGFTGNVILKEAEAFYSMLKRRNLTDDYIEKFNYELYGGTPILGINGNVMIGHGISSPLAVKNMVVHSRDLILAQLPEKIQSAFN
ncbi:MAG TPA: phosphate acyltransferase PlsX [Flavobacteriales bacterium]|nr:phosphate acyltransferase PlsX [Flavobacteriales bacterium]|tara:strand:+ start:10127 stop:11065 length:939 start_codon:yes stop_codon:yes gene_type:complete